MEEIEPIAHTITTADELFEQGDLENAAALYSRVIEVEFKFQGPSKSAQTCQWHVGLREKRAECYMQLGEYGKALSDIRATTKLMQDSTQAFHKMAVITYNMGDSHESLV